MSGDDHCPTCGSPVRIVSADEGTSHYEPIPHASSRSELRRQAFTTGACPICFRDTLVTDEMVERGAIAAFNRDTLDGPWTWESVPEQGRCNYRLTIRAALEAALAAPAARKDET